MKLLLIFIVMLNVYAEDLKQRIDKLIIPPKKQKIIYTQYDPFRRGDEVVKKVISRKNIDNTFFVTSILNGKVFVNSAWYGVGDLVNGYKIIQITQNSVLAKKGGKVYKFGLKRRDNIVKVEGK